MTLMAEQINSFFGEVGSDDVLNFHSFAFRSKQIKVAKPKTFN
jgi:hypothetical protein